MDRFAQRPARLDQLYASACSTPSDIFMHLPRLAALAAQCEHVTELGVREGVSSRALLWAQPAVLRCYDIDSTHKAKWDELVEARGRTDVRFEIADSRLIDLEETELLFIDTLHVYDQLKVELERHSPKAQEYIVLHDTESFRTRGEDPSKRGLWPAVEEFLALGTFRIVKHYPDNNGLTVLGRM